MSSSFKDALDTVVPPPFRCKAGRVLDSLSDEERNDLKEALTQGVPLAYIQRALKASGHNVSYPTLWKHLNSGCPCGNRTSPNKAG